MARIQWSWLILYIDAEKQKNIFTEIYLPVLIINYIYSKIDM